MAKLIIEHKTNKKTPLRTIQSFERGELFTIDGIGPYMATTSTHGRVDSCVDLSRGTIQPSPREDSCAMPVEGKLIYEENA